MVQRYEQTRKLQWYKRGAAYLTIEKKVAILEKMDCNPLCLFMQFSKHLFQILLQPQIEELVIYDIGIAFLGDEIFFQQSLQGRVDRTW